MQVHVSTFAGVAIMIITTPVNGYITRRLRVLAKSVMKVKDERINKTNEVMNAIKLVKCNGWETIFMVLFRPILYMGLCFTNLFAN